MKVQVPGAIDSDAWASEPPSPLLSTGGRPKGKRKKGLNVAKNNLAQGVCGNVWAHKDAGWKLMHQFSTGLELDSNTRSKGNPSEAPQSQLHLPSTSLEALEQLRVCLHCRRAVELDVELEETDRANDLTDVLLRLVESQASLTSAARTEVRNKLSGRHEPSSAPATPKYTQSKVGDEQVVHLAPSRLIAPEEGQEAIDVAICPVEELQDVNFAETPIPSLPKRPPVALGLAKLNRALSMRGAGGTTVSVKYAALIICPQAEALAFQAAHQLACTLAATFMDEHFAEAVRSLPRENPAGLLAALDDYLSSLTIVPTVYLANKRQTSEGVAEQIADYLLAESLAESMERKLCSAKGLCFSDVDLHGALRNRESSKLRRQFFLQVSKYLPLEDDWTVTHRLRQGLEVESNRLDGKPQMPSVSVSALTQVRQLMTPSTVALNICCGHADMAAKMVVDQLGKAGLPKIALDDVSHALSSVSNRRALDSKSYPFELLEPSHGDEACHVFVVPSVQLPPHHAFMGAFFRFSPSLGFPFAPLDLPIRFLFILVGPQSSEAELLILGHSLAVLSTDEDLMPNLAQVSEARDFINAIDIRLANLTFIPHAYLTTTKSGASTSAGSWDSKGQLTDHSEGEDQEPLSPKSTRSKKSNRSSEASVASKVSRSNSIHSLDSTHSSGDLFLHGRAKKDRGLKHKVQKAVKWTIGKLQKYSVPLVVGVTMAMIWSNVDQESYDSFTNGQIWGLELVGHEITLHFVVNDIFMCFFFGLAIKEVTEAVLPGGSLSPIRRAANPLISTLGGVVGPIVVYYIMVLVMDAAGSFDGTMCVTLKKDDDHRLRRLAGSGGDKEYGPKEQCSLSMLLKGWGVPTATDISLAWMFALLIFGAGHPAINVLLLLAIVDDALGMVIIAVFYPDPEAPVEPVWLLFVLLAMVVAYILRKLNLNLWHWWVLIPGPLSWLGLIKAHVHPALALVFVVPFMPAHAKKKKGDQSYLKHLGGINKALLKVVDMLPQTSAKKGKGEDGEELLDERSAAVKKAAEQLLHHTHAPLHSFEHALKLPVDLGMFFFGLANAGVQLGAFGGITLSVIIALLVGKTLGIAGFGMLAMCMGFALPAGVTMVDLISMSALGGVGLTVALFVANQAFVDPDLQGQAKMGAVLSVGCAFFAWAFRVIGYKIYPQPEEDVCEVIVEYADDDEEFDPENGEWTEDFLVEDIMQIMWTHRQYKLRGMRMPMNRASIRAASKEHSRSSQRLSTIGNIDFSTLGSLRRAGSQTSEMPAAPGDGLGPYNSEDTSDPRNKSKEASRSSGNLLDIPRTEDVDGPERARANRRHASSPPVFASDASE